MRVITEHLVEGKATELSIVVTDEPGQTNANHRYELSGFDTASNPSELEYPTGNSYQCITTIMFQNGSVQEFGVNGVTNEALIAVLIDRLRSFQAGPFACEENAEALNHLEMALSILQLRTKRRIARNVEGKNIA